MKRLLPPFVALLCVLPLQQALPQSPLRFDHRLQLGGEHDNNIFEATESEASALAARLLLNSQLKKQWQRASLHATYSGGLQLYPQYGVENKWITDVNARGAWHVNRWLQVNGALGGYLKVFLDAPFDFAYTQSSLTARLRMPDASVLGLTAASSRLDYRDSDFFDFGARGFEVSWRKALRRNLQVEGAVEISPRDYERPALAISSDTCCVVLPESQHDVLRGARLRVTFGRKSLLHLTGEYLDNDSNSHGYSYSSLRLSAIAGWRVSRPWLVRIAAMVQRKTYAEAVAPSLPTELDAERNESNFLVADVSYDASLRLTYLFRFALYRNEALLRDSFYTKALFFAGAEFRF